MLPSFKLDSKLASVKVVTFEEPSLVSSASAASAPPPPPPAFAMASCVEKVEWVQVQGAFSVRSFQYTAREGYGQPERELPCSMWLRMFGSLLWRKKETNLFFKSSDCISTVVAWKVQDGETCTRWLAEKSSKRIIRMCVARIVHTRRCLFSFLLNSFATSLCHCAIYSVRAVMCGVIWCSQTLSAATHYLDSIGSSRRITIGINIDHLGMNHTKQRGKKHSGHVQ